jgi:hypothetical protein
MKHLMPILALCGIACATPLHAAEECFQVMRSTVASAEGATTQGFLIMTDAHRFTFSAPPDSAVRALNLKNSLELNYQDGRLPFLVKLTQRDISLPYLTSEQLTAQLLEKYPGAQITPHPECHSGLGNGYSFRIERTNESQTRVVTMTYLVPFPGGLLEITQNALDDKSLAKRYVIGHLLTSFRMEQLKPTPAVASK